MQNLVDSILSSCLKCQFGTKFRQNKVMRFQSLYQHVIRKNPSNRKGQIKSRLYKLQKFREITHPPAIKCMKVSMDPFAIFIAFNFLLFTLHFR